ncbi:MAG: hypothetical protein ACLFVR_01615 [Thiohalospira sp.]
MKPNEKVLKPEESLQIIEKMINRTKGNLHDNSFYFLLWGWIVLIGILGHTILANFTDFSKPYLSWLIIIPGMIINIIYAMHQNKKKSISTHVDKVNFMTWIAFLVSYTITIIFMSKLNYNIVPIIFLLVGNATFLTGVIIKFKPLIWGGIIFWIGAIGLFTLPGNLNIFVPPLAIILGYLVPGYMLKSQNKEDA